MITLEQLRNEVAEIESPEIVCIVTETVPDMRKGRAPNQNPYYGRVRRRASRSGMFGASYENAVNRQRVREGKPVDDDGNVEYFNASALWFGKGEHVTKSIVRHTEKNEEYIVFYPTRTDAEGKPIANVDQWLLDGEPVEGEVLEDIKSWLTEKGKNKRQGTDKETPWRIFHLHSVKQVKMRGEIQEVAAA